jgi:hypothetical protein
MSSAIHTLLTAMSTMIEIICRSTLLSFTSRKVFSLLHGLRSLKLRRCPHVDCILAAIHLLRSLELQLTYDYFVSSSGLQFTSIVPTLERIGVLLTAKSSLQTNYIERRTLKNAQAASHILPPVVTATQIFDSSQFIELLLLSPFSIDER